MYGYFFIFLGLIITSFATFPVHQQAIQKDHEVRVLEGGLQQEEIRRITRALQIAIQDGVITPPATGYHALTDTELSSILLPRMAPIHESTRILPTEMRFMIDENGRLFHADTECEEVSCYVDAVELYRPKHTPPNPAE